MKILLVEDNKKISDNIKKYLELDDVSVDAAMDGIAGLEKFQNNSYDVVVLDLMMPKMGGDKLCIEIRKINDKIEYLHSKCINYIRNVIVL